MGPCEPSHPGCPRLTGSQRGLGPAGPTLLRLRPLNTHRATVAPTHLHAPPGGLSPATWGSSPPRGAYAPAMWGSSPPRRTPPP